LMDDDVVSNCISANSFFSNYGLGIEILPAGPNLNDTNDTDIGTQQLLNYPVITFAEYVNGITYVWGYVDTQDPELCKVELYMADTDPTGFGEGQTYLGEAVPDINGEFHFQLHSLSVSDVLTSLTIDHQNNTSEFSHNKTVLLGTVVPNRQDIVFEVFPNPASDAISVYINATTKNDFRLRILSMEGKIIQEHYLEKKSDKWLIPITNCGIGTFFVILYDNTTPLFTRKIVRIKQH
jgi:hypothetical protein